MNKIIPVQEPVSLRWVGGVGGDNTNTYEEPMRSIFVAVATTMVVIAATPTFAAKSHHHPTPTFASERQNQSILASQNQNQPKPSYDSCATLSVERGVLPGRGSSNPENHHTAFMRQCQDGKIPLGQ